MQILRKADTLKLAPGTMVWCNVTAISGWYTFREVRPRDGYIKISGYETWNPPHNFSLTDRQGRTFEQVFKEAL